VNRTDRLFALVEELRSVAPRPRTSKQLAERFEVSVRTVERDLSALQQSGVPIYATPGPGGGYAIDPQMALPPVNFTPAEATAVAVALARQRSSPFAAAERTALHKLLAAMSTTDAAAARQATDRVRIIEEKDGAVVPRLPPTARAIEEAIVAQRVVRLGYADRYGEVSDRAVEPVALLAKADLWYLIAWCRLRDGLRSFRLDRVHRATVTDEPAPYRDIEASVSEVPDLVIRSVLAD
jgi:predicted DNA-binding transcriptional regulator YafY